jgi:predicted  nucleic acid-binding Zn-ribbon protein
MSAEEPSKVAIGPIVAEERGLRRLLELQELDLSIDRLRSQLQTLESHEEVGLARGRVAQTDGALGQLKLAVDEVAINQRRLESDIDSLERKIAAERTRLYDGSVANPKELQSIEHEVEALGQRKSRLEDQLLEVMEKREELEAGLSEREAEATDARERLSEIEGTSAKDLVDVERALGERSAERMALVPAFDPDLLELYEDLRRQKKGVAAVALVDGVCQGCHQKMSPVYLDRLKRAEGVRRCEYCRRILVIS